ncbi:MAG TPA: DUF1549 domain-containing protein [Vicinamibacteria bacterium]|nr:DUF1549 domain-containing protein [Vicinamibacteria bacterium]
MSPILGAVVLLLGGAAARSSEPPDVSFRNHVIPILTKMGCNSGSCHGAASGKNGFKLTLRGYDPETDYLTLTRQAAGRRTNPLEPARSLLLLKPTRAVPHMGGRRFTVDSPEYRAIASWIAAGAPPPRESDARIRRLEVAPPRRTLADGERMRLTVRAHFSDGAVEDVTRWAAFSSGDQTVAAVDDTGLVEAQGHGETAVNVAYLSLVGHTRVAIPFPRAVDESVFADSPRHNFIDDLVVTKLRQLRLAPSPPASDAAFIRRAFLDAAGILPTPEERERFLGDPAPDKRARLVDALLERPEFVDYWAYKWSDVLLVSTRKLSRKNAQSFYGWIRAAVAANTPWDAFARELTTASGRSDEQGAVNYFLIHRNPIDLAENYTQAFLGVTITCARCHNHPLEKWTQKDYYGYANLFARVANKTDGGVSTVYSAAAGDLNLGQGSSSPRVGRPLPPRPLDGIPLPAGSPRDRREYLADWLTSPANPLFARTVVNRVWGNFFGRGLVDPVDDLRATNPASNEELLAAVTRDFVGHGFDVKHLVRTIMGSAAYQRSSEASALNLDDDRYGSRYLARRLPAEVILDALSQVTGVPETFDGYAPGTRALQLPDTRVKSYFLTAFGRPERVVTSSGERQPDPSLTQALHAINGDTLNRKLMSPEGSLARLVSAGASDQTVVRTLYLSALSREPTPEEQGAVADAMARDAGGSGGSPENRRLALEDVAWALLTSKEFLFNH